MPWDLLVHRIVVYTFEKLFDLPVYWCVKTIEENLKKEVDFINEGKNCEKAKELNTLKYVFLLK